MHDTWRNQRKKRKRKKKIKKRLHLIVFSLCFLGGRERGVCGMFEYIFIKGMIDPYPIHAWVHIFLDARAGVFPELKPL